MSENNQLQMTNHSEQHSAPRRLYRSRNHRIFGGVLGGMADYFNLDPLLMRILCIVILTFPGPGLLAYIIGWVIIPLEPAGDPAHS